MSPTYFYFIVIIIGIIAMAIGIKAKIPGKYATQIAYVAMIFTTVGIVTNGILSTIFMILGVVTFLISAARARKIF